MSEEEFTGRYQDGWVSRRFVLPLRNIKKESPLIIHGRRFPYPEKLTIYIYVNGKLIHKAVNPDSQFTITTTIQPMYKGNLEIVASDYFVPKEKRINQDVRKLTFYLDDVIVPGLPDLMEPYLDLFDFKPTKKVYFLDDEVWDLISFLVNDKYKVPHRSMLNPIKEGEWWENVEPPVATSIEGTVYDKFSGYPLKQADVKLLDGDKKLVMETTVDDQGYYRFEDVKPGAYFVTGTSQVYGEQQVGVHKDKHGKIIHIQLQPLW